MKRLGMLVAAFGIGWTAFGEAYEWPADTSGGLTFKDGKTYAVTVASGTIANNGGVILVTNATLDAWSADANRVEFENQLGGIVTLEKDAVLRTFTFKNKGILNLNLGSRIELESFNCTDCASGSKINADGGLVVFSNVSRPSNYYWFKNYYYNYPEIYVMTGGLVISNAVSGALSGYMPPIKSAAVHDGGVTYTGCGTIYVGPGSDNNTFNGGVTVRGNVVLAINNDRFFGVQPAVPTDNIFWQSSGAILFGNASNFEVTRNRNIVLGENVTFVGGSSSSLRILSTVRGETDTVVTTTVRPAADWAGALVLSPGENRTNLVGRLQSGGRLVIESGTTALCADKAGKASVGEALIGIGGTQLSSYSDSKNILQVAGGEVSLVDGKGYVVIGNYGQLEVTNGIFNASTREILNGYGGAGRVIVKGSGMVKGYTFRLSQNESKDAAGDIPTQLSVSTGGVVWVKEFTLGTSNHCCRIDLNGGTIRGRESWTSFLGKSDADWPNVPVYVHEGGAIFDTDGFNLGCYLPLQSAAAERDGGVTKKGAGTFTFNKANTYTGPTRIFAGTLAFATVGGYPGGDIEVDAPLLASRAANSPCITVPSLTFNQDAKIRLLVPTGYDLKNFKAYHPVLKSTAAFTGTLPAAEAVDAATGAVLPEPVRLRLSADGKTIEAKPITSGIVLIVR